MTLDQIDKRFAFITTSDGQHWQVLRLDPDTGEPVDWDEEATSALVREHAAPADDLTPLASSP